MQIPPTRVVRRCWERVYAELKRAKEERTLQIAMCNIVHMCGEREGDG